MSDFHSSTDLNLLLCYSLHLIHSHSICSWLWCQPTPFTSQLLSLPNVFIDSYHIVSQPSLGSGEQAKPFSSGLSMQWHGCCVWGSSSSSLLHVGSQSCDQDPRRSQAAVHSAGSTSLSLLAVLGPAHVKASLTLPKATWKPRGPPCLIRNAGSDEWSYIILGAVSRTACTKLFILVC